MICPLFYKQEIKAQKDQRTYPWWHSREEAEPGFGLASTTSWAIFFATSHHCLESTGLHVSKHTT